MAAMGVQDSQGIDHHANRAADNIVIDGEKASPSEEGTISETDTTPKVCETVNFEVDDPDNPHNWSFVSLPSNPIPCMILFRWTKSRSPCLGTTLELSAVPMLTVAVDS